MAGNLKIEKLPFRSTQCSLEMDICLVKVLAGEVAISDSAQCTWKSGAGMKEACTFVSNMWLGQDLELSKNDESEPKGLVNEDGGPDVFKTNEGEEVEKQKGRVPGSCTYWHR